MEHLEHRGQSPVVVIGGSAGGIEALLTLVAELPRNFPLPIFVVVHIGRYRSVLPSLLKRAGVLPASHATDGEVYQPGHIYVAPPDRHLEVRGDRLVLTHGPRENHSRPAIDPLFRSAATSFGNKVIAVILSGALSDGTSGLAMIKSRGGVTIVQDPAEAVTEGMPESAMRAVQVDHILPSQQIGRLLVSLGEDATRVGENGHMPHEQDADRKMIKQDFDEQEKDQRAGRLTLFTCPDCGGTLWQSSTGPVPHFRCHVGHAWGAEDLLGNKSEELEAALWSSVRLLEERATLTRQVAERVRLTNGDAHRIKGIHEQAELDERRADAIRELLNAPLGEALQLVQAIPVESETGV